MKSVRWANRVAAAAGIGILIFAFGYLRIRNWVPFAGALIVYASFLWMLWPRRDPVVQVLPDGISAEEYNRALGERRANSVRDHLIEAGVGPNQIRTLSYGEDQPEDLGHDEAAWAANRRAVFVLLRPR